MKRSIALLALMGGMTVLSACGEVSNATVALPPTTSSSTTTTVPTPDLQGNYCWTEVNKETPEGVEGLCYTDLSKVRWDLFLHYGMPEVKDYRPTETITYKRTAFTPTGQEIDLPSQQEAPSHWKEVEQSKKESKENKVARYKKMSKRFSKRSI